MPLHRHTQRTPIVKDDKPERRHTQRTSVPEEIRQDDSRAQTVPASEESKPGRRAQRTFVPKEIRWEGLRVQPGSTPEEIRPERRHTQRTSVPEEIPNEYHSPQPLDAPGVIQPEPFYMPEPPSAQNSVIMVRDLRKSYRSAGETTEILHGLNFDIYENEFVAILGASGTGKTTLLNILGGLDHADQGLVQVGGVNIANLNARQLNEYRRQQVGFVFQFYSLLPTLTVEENIRYVAELSDHPMNVQDVLEKVGMWEKRNRFPSQLSSGQQQRVAIARALVKAPSIILADEPTGALDLPTSKEVLIAMEEITAQKIGTIVLITHNPEICKICDRAIVMQQGNIASIEVNPCKISATELRW